MPNFSLTTQWNIPAPIETVWLAMIDTEQWPNWWKYIKKVEEIKAGDQFGINSIKQYLWKTSLPYQLILNLEVTRLEPYQLISVNVSGDLEGKGYCKFSVQPQHTSIFFVWNVQTCKHWMDYFPAISYPIFVWNHTQVMKQGEKCLIQRLSYD